MWLKVRMREEEREASQETSEWREKSKLKKNNGIFVRIVPIVELYRNKYQIYLAFGTSNVGGFLVFGVLNAKILAFTIPNANVIRALLSTHWYCIRKKYTPMYMVYVCHVIGNRGSKYDFS